ncbi:pyridoxamine 5'-phosphate oxidase family protein [Microbispora sp. RL4-1S]|uniref:Pyridoxamine 5'-phosphate oxidase family protein n=1 Tax=Microbispora oryzae TaxID=2806554 RepID=A0A941AHC3_9ACTN|nr:pyridoxamine 5'-phosphate oxidase family protein [Microbispora oryzae]MBP2703931.1 pyridoxamine 5'-phosphate oxidase family protein [Microbispora oryzae]
MSHTKSTPGDLGRRVAYQRKRLGLTRQEVAERAGMAPGFVEYLEERPASLTEGSLLRLAYALETTVDELLGATADRPAGAGTAVVRPLLDALDLEECMRLIWPGGIGRVAFTGPDGPVVLPVNYRLHHGEVIFRTAAGGSLDRSVGVVEGCMTGFEIDHIDEVRSEGWSVLIQGQAQPVGPGEPPVPGLEPWAGGERTLVVRIVPRHVTGRRIRAF